MKQLAKSLVAVALVAGLNTAFAADGRKEAVLDMGKGAFKLTVSVLDDREGPYDFAKNPGIGKNMSGKTYQTQEVMFNGKLNNTSIVLVYQATAQKIDPKNSKKLSAEHMAQEEIKAAGFEGRSTQFDCPPAPIDGATAVCYKMSGDVIFEGKSAGKTARFLMAVSWANDTQGYTLMGSAREMDVAKFNADPAFTEKQAYNAFGSLWKYHKVTKN